MSKRIKIALKQELKNYNRLRKQHSELSELFCKHPEITIDWDQMNKQLDESLERIKRFRFDLWLHKQLDKLE